MKASRDPLALSILERAVLFLFLFSSIWLSTFGKEVVFGGKMRHELPSARLPQLRLWVDGAVEHPGLYLVDKGTCLEQVLYRAGRLSSLDLAKVDLKKPIRSSGTFLFPSKEFMVIYLFKDGVHERRLLPLGSDFAYLDSLQIPGLIVKSSRKKLRNGESFLII